jgi:hypothetical protein
MAQGKPQKPIDLNRPLSEQIPIPKLSLEDRLALAKYRRAAPEVFGKVLNWQNTALGLTVGAIGHMTGLATGTKPGISIGGNAIRFTNNPAGGVSAVTLGNATIYSRHPESQPGYRQKNGVTVQEHERQHTLQGQMLGPMYIPSNIAGGLYALSKGQDWHGEANWNEVGPQQNPPRPWAKR